MGYTVNKFLLIVVALFVFVSPVFGAVFYISPSGDNENEGTGCEDAFLTFTVAEAAMSANDTLYLCDGTYTPGTTGMLHPSVAGSDPGYTTYEAVNYGSAILDAENTNDAPCEILANWTKIKGVVCTNSGSGHSVVQIEADNTVIQEVTAYDAQDGNNTYHFRFKSAADNNLLEDSASWGIGRNCVILEGGASNNTVRRFYCALGEHDGTGGGQACAQIYGADNTVMENFICTTGEAGLQEGWAFSPTGVVTNGLSIWDNSQNTTDNNTIYGSVVFNIDRTNRSGLSKDFGITGKADQVTGNALVDCVSIGDDYGPNEYAFTIGQSQDNVSVTNCTFTDADEDSVVATSTSADYGNTESLTITDTIIMGGDVCGYEDEGLTGYGGASFLNTFTHTYNTLYGNGTHFCDDEQSGTENNFDPAFDTATYGNGAYLMQPAALVGYGSGGGDIGAEVLYRYEDGVLSETALWPWPMEDRILEELGMSVTYSVDQGNGESGGLWKTLTGVYATSPPAGIVGITIE